MSRGSTSAGGSPRNGCLAQLRRAPRDAERAVDGLLVGRVRAAARAPRRTRREPVARSSAVPKRSGAATTSSTGTPSTVTPTARRSSRSITATIWGSAAKRAEQGARIRRRADHRELLARVAPAPHVARRLAAERRRDAADQLPGAVEQQPAPRPRLGLAGERLEQPRLGLRPDPGHAAQPARGRRLAQLVGGAHAERPRQLHRAPRAEPQVAAEADEVGRELALELRQLGDLARSRRARAAAPRSPGRCRAARARDPTAPARRRAPPAPRIVSAARR